MITFTKHCYGREYTLHIDDEEACDQSWISLVSEFQDFLNGCGYIIADKTMFDMAEILSAAYDDVLGKKHGKQERNNW